MKKYTFHEIRGMFLKFNEDNNQTSKGSAKKLHAAAVLKDSAFNENYQGMDEEHRTYLFSSDNKMFYPNMCSSSCFAYNKVDNMDCFRLDYLNPNKDFEFCYLVEE